MILSTSHQKGLCGDTSIGMGPLALVSFTDLNPIQLFHHIFQSSPSAPHIPSSAIRGNAQPKV